MESEVDRNNMANRADRLTIWFTGAAVVVLLAGCSMSASGHGGAAATSTPTPTLISTSPGPAPVQPQVDAPSDASSALSAANGTIAADFKAFYDIFVGNIPGDSMSAFETGVMLKATNEFIDQTGDDPNSKGVSGSPNTWDVDQSASSASTLSSGGKSYPFGSVVSVGCLNTNMKFIYTKDAPPAPPSKFAEKITVQYDAAKRVWLIVDEQPAKTKDAAAICAASH